MNAVDLVGGQLEAHGEVAAQRENALGVGPDGHLAVLELGHRAGRPDRGMGHVGLAVGGLDDLDAVGQHALLFVHHLVLGRQRQQMVVDAGLVRQRRAGRPFRASCERHARLDRLLLALGDNAEKAAVAHHGDDAGHRLDRRFVDGLQLRAILGRTHHAAMGHAGQPQVLHIGDAAGDLAGNVETLDRLADDLVGGRRLRLCLSRDLAMEIGVAGQIAIAHLAAVRRADDTIRHRKRRGIDAEALGREFDENLAHLRASEAQRNAAVFDRLAAGGHAFIGGFLGIAGNHVQARERQVEFFRRDLRQGGGDALPQFDLAGADRRGAVRIDADPGIEHAVAGEASGQRRRLLRERQLQDQPRRQSESDDDSA